jgi:hypothetical protein
MEYDTSDWTEALITIEAQGKAPKKYGEGVFRFGATMTLEVILPRRGWELVKSTKNYVYLRPPKNQIRGPYTLRIKIPTQEQALEIALKCYGKGESWMGQLGEWPAWYTHERKRRMNEIAPSENRLSVTEKFAYELPPESSLYIGEWGVWEIKVVKSDGAFEVSESGDIQRDRAGALNYSSIVEGQELSYELTQYERSPRAREQCIACHSTSCKVCAMDFGNIYGDIGAGFIHVHHAVPISQQSGEYEVDPVIDLVPLCPNCHAMIHRRNPPYNVEELKDIILNQKVKF